MDLNLKTTQHGEVAFFGELIVSIHEYIPGNQQDRPLVLDLIERLNQWQNQEKRKEDRELNLTEQAELHSYAIYED